MRLTSISLSGFMGFPPGAEATLADLGHRNVLIGPNNAGKSTVPRFLRLLCSFVHKAGSTGNFTAEPEPSRHWWWKSDTSQRISAEIAVADAPRAEKHLTDSEREWFIREGAGRFRVEIDARTDEKALASVLPIAHMDGEDFLVLRPPNEGRTRAWLAGHGEKGPRWAPDQPKSGLGYAKYARSLLQSLAPRFLVIEPVRSVSLRMNQLSAGDGSSLVAQLGQLEQASPPRFRAWHARLLRTINRLLAASGMPKIRRLTVRGTPATLWVQPLDEELAPIPLQSMGLGIEQLVIILAALDPEQDSKHEICIIEEPENYLHPRLLRHFMHHLGTLDRWQFIITTHSSDLLDTLGDKDRVYRFSQDEGLACHIEPCVRFEEFSAALDSLGLSGGTLLQANAIIWVEGPSDRLYMRHWIKAVDALGRGDAAPLREGADYSFAYYGGSLLAHVTVGEGQDDDTDLVHLLRINRFAVVVMDRDLPPEAPDTELLPRKQRIQTEAACETEHRLAIVTTGREIENDVPADALCEAATRRLGGEHPKLDGSLVTGDQPFELEIVNQLGVPKAEQEKAKRKLARKVPLALEVVKILREREITDHPAYVSKIVDFLRKSRCT